MSILSKASHRKTRKQLRRRGSKASHRRTAKRRCILEQLEDRRLLAVELFADSFEQGQWGGQWVEDSQNDWFTSSSRKIDGSFAAKVDGWTVDSTLKMANPLDLTGQSSAELTFSWFIENNWDTGEYIALDFYNGGSWIEVASLNGENGSKPHEQVWHNETITIDGSYLHDDFNLRFRAKVSRGSEDGHVDNVKITGISAGPPEISISDSTLAEEGSAQTFVSAGSGGIESPRRITIGPDGNLYVSNKDVGNILRYDGTNGSFIDTFVATGSGGLATPGGLSFGPDGNLYVETDTEVLRFDGTSGDYIDTFISGFGSARDAVFGPNGDLYVGEGDTNEILRFDGTTGQFISTFVTAGSGGLDSSRAIAFGPDGNLYVASRGSGDVLRYDGATGAFMDAFIPNGTQGLYDPWGLAFDGQGHLFVSRVGVHEVLRFDAATGAFLDRPVSSVSGFVSNPTGLIMSPRGDLLIASRGSDEVISYNVGPTVTLSSPSPQQVTVDYVTSDGSAVGGDDYTASSGTLSFSPGETTKRILFVAIDDGVAESNESFSVTLSNPTGGATIAGATATATIIDDDSTREISIDDVTATEGDNTPHYRGRFVDGVPGAHFNPLTFGPNGDVYTAVGTGTGYNTIQRFDGTTGAFIETFMDNSDPDHKINGVRDIVFHPTDGKVYVASAYTDEVLRYDAQTGNFIDVFVSANSGGIDHPDGMMFGPDSNNDGNPELYVTGWLSHDVVRYDGATGQPLGSYIAPGSGGLNSPFSLAFRADEVFVTSAGTDQILKYDADSGAYLGVAASTGLDYPRGLTFGPDDLLYVTSGDNDRILRFTPTGTYVDDYMPAGTGGMDNPRTPRFGPDGNLYVTSTGNDEVMRFGTESEAVFTVSLSTPTSLPVTVDYSTTDNTAIAGSDYVAVSQTLTFDPGVTSRTVLVPVLDDTAPELTENFFVNLSNASGAVIQAGQGLGTILDDGDVGNQPPTANAGADQTVGDADGSGDQTVTLGGSGSDSDGTIVGYQWTEGATVLGTTASISPTLGVGTHTLTFTVTDNDGATGSDTVVVTVDPNQGPTANAGADQTISDGDGNGSETVILVGSGSDSDGTIVGYQWTEGAALLGTTASISPSLTVGVHTLTLTVTDNGGASAADSVVVTIEAASTGPNLAHGTVTGVSSSVWATVTLADNYASMVVIASANYVSASGPGVVRIQNATGNSFDVRVDSAGGTSISNVDVHYIVVEEGVYDKAGFKLEAVKYNSTVTDENNSWSGESRSYGQSYSAPVVIGQVMSYNDPDWSTFWAAGSSRTSAPSSSTLTVGKHVGEDSDNTRADETIGYFVIETNTSGTAQIEGLPYVAAVGGDTIRGVGDSPSYNYSYSAMANSKTAVVSQAGMDGGNGGWAVLYGTDPITPTGSTLKLAIEEDQSKDTERRHTTEQVAYFIIDPPLSSAAAESAKSLELEGIPSGPVLDIFTTKRGQPSSLSRQTLELESRSESIEDQPEHPVRASNQLALTSHGSTAVGTEEPETRLRSLDAFFASEVAEDLLAEELLDSLF